MAELPTAELEALRSAAADLKDVLISLTTAKKEEAAASNEAANADKKKAAAANSVGGAFLKFGGSLLNAVTATYGLAKTFASIAESGRQFAEKTGATATRGAQFQLDINKIVRNDALKFGADQQVIAEQIRGAATSFADTFVGAAAGMQISAQGSAEFARSLSTGFKSEFTLTSQSMRALVTVGAATTKEFDAFRKASGRAGLSSGQFANLVNKNSLSFMLYGPNFAKAAVNAERLGISLSSVQKAQESMVTNLDGTIDTIAQLNQLGAGIDFGTLVTMAETQGPEATLKYLQSTIPPSLFQSASTRALISKLGIPLEDLLKSQGSVQASAADKIEKAFTEVATPASRAAKSLADLNEDLKALDENKTMEIITGVVGVGTAIKGLILSLIAFAGALGLATKRLFGLGGPGEGLFGTKPKIPTPETPGGKPDTGFMGKFNAKDMLAGAAAMIIVAGALYVTAKAVQEFMKVNWPALGMAGAALLGLVGAVALLGLAVSGPQALLLLAGAGVMSIMAGALYLVGAAITKAGPGLESLGKMLKTAFDGVAPAVTATSDGLTSMFAELKTMSAGKIVAIGLALPGFATGLGLLAAALVVFPTMELGRVASKIQIFGTANNAATNIGKLTAALTELRTVLAGIDVRKLAQITAFTESKPESKIPSATPKITTDITPTAIAKNSMMALSPLAATGGSSLEKKIDDLITVLRDANTIIQIGNTTQQVPRVAVARVGAYDRYGRS